MSRTQQYNVVYGMDKIERPNICTMYHYPPTKLHACFHGECFICKCKAHSQKFCPIRRCLRCGVYGHSEVVCIKKGTKE